MTGLEVGLLQFGIGAAQSLFGRSTEQARVRQANKQRQQASDFDYYQRLAIRNRQWEDTKEAYRLKVDAYKEGITSREKMTAMAMTQDQLRMNELMKGMKFADQDASIGLAQSQGRIQAGMQQGRTAGRRMALDSASVLRNQAKREQRMVGELFASNLRGQARVQQLDAQNRAAWQQVRFAPKYGAPLMQAPVAMESGPGMMSLFSGLGGAALSGFTAGMQQGNFRSQLRANNPADVPIPD
jgi:hypothetical protein